MKSLWLDTVKLPSFASLRGQHKTDVLVIGGGITGILCAYMLKQAGVDCLLAEAETICSGVTKNTTAKITLQHGLVYASLLRTFGQELTQMYLQANLAALRQYRTLCRDISCDFQEMDAFVYALSDVDQLHRELSALQRLSFPATFASQLPLPFPVVGAVRFPAQGQFHPLKFLSAIAEGLPILEHTRILEVKPGLAISHHGKIAAKKIIIATHFPFLNKRGAYFLKLYQHRSYVLALKKASVFSGMYVDAAADGLSFRHQDGLLLLGGGAHHTGKTGGGWQTLTEAVHRFYPDAREAYRWAAQDCMSLDNVPYIGQYAPTTPDLFVATGFHKWGMTSSMVSALILTDMVLEKRNPYAPVFAPARSMLRPQLAANIANSSLHLLTPTRPRCPHMGCALKFNRQERSWDCPCHGSRFTQDGKLIDNPANRDLRR